MFGGADPARLVFTLNATDALNMALKGVLANGDHVVTTEVEHNSVTRPLNAMEADGLITLTRVGSSADGTINVVINGIEVPLSKVVSVQD